MRSETLARQARDTPGFQRAASLITHYFQRLPPRPSRPAARSLTLISEDLTAKVCLVHKSSQGHERSTKPSSSCALYHRKTTAMTRGRLTYGTSGLINLVTADDVASPVRSYLTHVSVNSVVPSLISSELGFEEVREHFLDQREPVPTLPPRYDATGH